MSEELRKDLRQVTTGSLTLARSGQAFPGWMKTVLRIAGIYNLAWGAMVVLFPLALFKWLGTEPPNYPSLWQCVGMIVGVYGIGYWIAASDPYRHWPIVLVGFLGKIFGPIGFISTATKGELPWSWGWTILTNDVIWWVPFALILYNAFRHNTDPRPEEKFGKIWSRDEALRNTKDEQGRTLQELFAGRKVLLVFLRHSGCTFCREALSSLQKIKPQLDQQGIRLAIAHLGPTGDPDRFFASYQMHDDVIRISDPNCGLFRAFGLQRGNLGQLFSLQVWWRGFVAAILHRHGLGKLVGDGFQMPGAFLLQDGKVIAEHRHRNAADEPDYYQLACRVS